MSEGLSRFIPEKLKLPIVAETPEEYLELLKSQGSKELEIKPFRETQKAGTDSVNIGLMYGLEFKAKTSSGRSLRYKHRVKSAIVNRYNSGGFNPEVRELHPSDRDPNAENLYSNAAAAADELNQVLPELKLVITIRGGILSDEDREGFLEVAKKKIYTPYNQDINITFLNPKGDAPKPV